MPEWLGHVIEIVALLVLGWQQRKHRTAIGAVAAAAETSTADVGKLRELIKSSLRPPAIIGFDCEHDQNVWDLHAYRWCADCGALRPPASEWYKPGADLTPRSLPPPQPCGNCNHERKQHNTDGGCKVPGCVCGGYNGWREAR